MGFTLRDGLSFCTVDDRAIFLDVPNDRYFCLSRGASEALVTLDGTKGLAAASPLRGLVRDGILRETAALSVPCPCPALPVYGTLLDPRATTAFSHDTFEALCRRVAAEFGLRLLGLHRMVRRLSGAAGDLPPVSPAMAARASHAFAAASLWRSRQRFCLSISIATMHWLLHRQAAAHMVMGVKMQPFQAHCWVQADGLLINDDPDLVRNFTPILVV